MRIFIIVQWLVSGQVTTRHLCASNVDNVIIIGLDCKQNQILPDDTFSWLVEHLFCEGDTVIDMDSDKASTFMAALKKRTQCSLDNISIVYCATDWGQFLHKIQL